MSKDYNNRFNILLKYFDITRRDVARITGFQYSALRNHTRAGNFSRWAKMIVWVFEEMKTKMDNK